MQIIIMAFFLKYYVLVACTFSVFVGWVAKFDFKIGGKEIPRPYEFFIGFAGSAIGWLALYSYIVILQNVPLVQFSFADILLLFFAIFGIIGFLPRLLIDILGALGQIIAAAISKLTS